MPVRNRLHVAILIPTVLVLVVLGLAWALTDPSPARGDRLVVISTADGGSGSLRQTIAGAAHGDSILIPAGTYTLTSGSELTVDKNLILIGKYLGMFADTVPRGEQPVQITRVTVVLPAGNEPPVIEGEGHVVKG